MLACCSCDSGSSPLTRGKLLPLGDVSFAHGLIPAHAGKTGHPARRWRPRTAHPRSRGENPALVTMDEIWKGSSPLTRGKQSREMERITRDRLIPAHAGKTGGSAIPPGLDWAHPRSRGENPYRVMAARRATGSSPLTRGKPAAQRLSDMRKRLIPAHAGKTCSSRAARALTTAHPRSRGENHRRSAPNGIKNGSSPLTRGKPGAIEELAKAGGLIPAHAGKTRCCRRCR